MFFMQLSVLDLYTMDYDIFLSLGLYTNLYYGSVLDRRNITCFLAFSLSTYFLRKKNGGFKTICHRRFGICIVHVFSTRRSII